MTSKAPALHAELQKQLNEQHMQQQAAQQFSAGNDRGGGHHNQGGDVDDADEFYYSMLGWATFGAIAVSWFAMMSIQAARAQT